MQGLAAEAWQALQAEAASQGHSIIVASAHRSITQQRSVFRSKLWGTTDAAIDSRLRYSAPPGASLHHTGYSLDFTEAGGTFGSFGGSASFRWLSENNYYNAKRFGFVPSYPPGVANGPVSESWEYTFIGVDFIACGQSVGQPLEPNPDCGGR